MNNRNREQDPKTNRREHAGLKLAKVLFPLIGAALCLGGVIQGAFLHLPILSALLLFIASLCLGAASWVFMGRELGRYYSKETGKLHNEQESRIATTCDPTALSGKNRAAWALVLLGVICFIFAIVLGGEKITLILTAWLLG